jgi:hypothetical protein
MLCVAPPILFLVPAGATNYWLRDVPIIFVWPPDEVAWPERLLSMPLRYEETRFFFYVLEPMVADYAMWSCGWFFCY